MSKIFGIGLPRTGTASLSEALVILGYKTRHYPKYISRVDNFDALVDNPIPLFYKDLDNKYPNSKFILTIRNKNNWLKSLYKASKRFQWNKLTPDGRCGPEVYESHKKLLGCIGYDEKSVVNGYNNHINNVKNYFEYKNNLLIINICNGDGWNKLCPFLNKKIPDVEFPHYNKSK